LGSDVVDYVKPFAKLRSDISPSRWTAGTNQRAPHKPFLLLSVMDLIGQGLIKTNFIELNADLMDIFDLYWVKIMGEERRGTPLFPFYHLQSDQFWHLIPMPGMEQALSV
jgi:putative restriction endonuclease